MSSRNFNQRFPQSQRSRHRCRRNQISVSQGGHKKTVPEINVASHFDFSPLPGFV